MSAAEPLVGEVRCRNIDHGLKDICLLAQLTGPVGVGGLAQGADGDINFFLVLPGYCDPSCPDGDPSVLGQAHISLGDASNSTDNSSWTYAVPTGPGVDPSGGMPLGGE